MGAQSGFKSRSRVIAVGRAGFKSNTKNRLGRFEPPGSRFEPPGRSGSGILGQPCRSGSGILGQPCRAGSGLLGHTEMAGSGHFRSGSDPLEIRILELDLTGSRSANCGSGSANARSGIRVKKLRLDPAQNFWIRL